MEKFEYNADLMNEVIERLYRRCDREDLKEICEILDKIYLKNGNINYEFRHEYSAISGKMGELRNEFSAESNPFQLQTLALNINLLYDYAVENNKEYLKNLFKLKDHIFLEIGRIDYIDSVDESIRNAKSELHQEIEEALSKVRSIDDQINSLESTSNELDKKYSSFIKKIDNTNGQVDNLKVRLKEVDKDIDQSRDKIKSYQQESIAILGIFASIVLAFTGGLAFSSSVLQNFNKGTIYRVSFVILLIGFVLINILYALFHYIDRLVNEKKNRRIKPLFITNIAFIIMMAGVLIAWYHGIAEQVQIKNAKVVEQEIFQEKSSPSSISTKD